MYQRADEIQLDPHLVRRWRDACAGGRQGSVVTLPGILVFLGILSLFFILASDHF